jgi:hypothetical protein
MSTRSDAQEIAEIVQRTTANLLSFSAMRGRAGIELRYTIGDLNAYVRDYLADGSFADRLRTCFRLATSAGISLDWMDKVIDGLVKEKPSTLMAISVVENALIMAVAQDGRIIAATTYQSRDDIDITMRRMKVWFDILKEMFADTLSGAGYDAFITLVAAITRHLADSARPLPRMLRYDLAASMPGLAISQYIYGEGGRAEELSAENKTVHPLFCQRTLRALSA